MNLTMLLEMAVDGHRKRVLFGPAETGLSAARLHALALGGASLLHERDASALVYVDVNGSAFPVALFAAAYAGIPLVPLNYRLGAEQLRGLLHRHPGAVAIAEDAVRPVLDAAAVPSFTTDEWLSAAAAAAAEATPHSEDDAAAVLIYTSGTTAEPKGVVLRHDNLVGYVLETVEFAGAAADETMLVSVPPYHIAAVANVITNLYAGRRCVMLGRFDAETWLETVRRERVTHALVVPTMLARIVDSGADTHVPTLRSLAYGGASMPRHVIERALALWPHVAFVNAYGLTETSSTVAILGPEDHRAAVTSADPKVRARLSSAGRPLPGVDVRIRDASGRPVPPNTVGRIWVKGAQVSGEYTGQGSVLDGEGYFDTRDDGCLDDDGYLFIAGRTDDTIIRGGENIAPAEIEDVLRDHPGIADAVVIGLPDPEWGQRLEAVVVARGGHPIDVDDVREHVRRRLRSSKTPDRVHVWAELPHTETGKLARRDVLALLEAAPPAAP